MTDLVAVASRDEEEDGARDIEADGNISREGGGGRL